MEGQNHVYCFLSIGIFIFDFFYKRSACHSVLHCQAAPAPPVSHTVSPQDLLQKPAWRARLLSGNDLAKCRFNRRQLWVISRSECPVGPLSAPANCIVLDTTVRRAKNIDGLLNCWCCLCERDLLTVDCYKLT